MKKNNLQIQDKKRHLRSTNHLTRPPRLEGKVKNARMNPVRKLKQNKKETPVGSISEFSWSHFEEDYYDDDEI